MTGHCFFLHKADGLSRRHRSPLADENAGSALPIPDELTAAKRRVNIPITIVPEALDFTQLIRAGETVGLAEATAEPVFLTRMLDTQAQRCPPFRVSALIELDERL
jgi:hypothetical protein